MIGTIPHKELRQLEEASWSLRPARLTPPQPWTTQGHMSNEKNPGCLGYLGDDILPSYIGIIINHYKDPY